MKRVRIATTGRRRFRRTFSSAARPLVITEATAYDLEHGWPKYVVTHRRTGMSICHVGSLRTARRILADLLKVWTWDCGVEGVSDSRVTARCMRIFDRYGAEYERAQSALGADLGACATVRS